MADLNQIKAAFLDISAELDGISDESLRRGSKTYPCFARLDQMAAMDVNDTEAARLRHDPDLQPVIDKITRMKRINGLRLEITMAKTLIQSPTPWKTLEQFVYYPNYLELARMEFEGGELAPGNRVAFLGSGPLPLTLISLCSRYGIKGVGIERCHDYAALSRQLISVLGLDDRIRILEGDHFALPLPEPCDLIMVGADALPKDEIFCHLSARLGPGGKLSYRIYEKGLRRLLDVQSEFRLPPGLTEYRRVRPEPPVNNTSVFVVKTET